MKKATSIFTALLVANSFHVAAQDFNPPSNSDYVNDLTRIYVDDPMNDLTDLPASLNCVLNNIGLGNPVLVNRIWNASYPLTECHGGDDEGTVRVVVSSSRASNSTPQEVIGWMDFEPLGIKYIMALTMYESPAVVPPFGEFDMRFYMVHPNDETTVPETHLDMAKVVARAQTNGVLLTTKRNNRARDQYTHSNVMFRNSGKDIAIVGADRKTWRTPTDINVIGLGSEAYFQSSLANGLGKSCKARDVTYANTWDYKLYDYDTGNRVNIENGTVNLKFLNSEGDEVDYGRGHVSPGSYWFKDRRRGGVHRPSFSAIDEVTDEELSVIWSPATLSEVKMLEVDASTKDLKLTTCGGKVVEYDSDFSVFKYRDQTADLSNCPLRTKDEIVDGQTVTVKYVPVFAEGREIWSKLYDTNITFKPSSNNNDTEHKVVDPVGKVNVKLPLTADSELLSGTQVTPMVCVNDWQCPHVIPGVNEDAYGARDFSYLMLNNKISVSDWDRFEKLFFPYTQPVHQNTWKNANGGEDREGYKKAHRYLLTPLDVSALPDGTLPGTLYYDLNANGTLDASDDLPIMTNLQRVTRAIDGDGDNITVDKWINGATGQEISSSDIANDHDEGLPRFFFDVVTLDDFNAGCDGLNSVDEADHSFKMCDSKIAYGSGPRSWESSYYLKSNGEFVTQGTSLPVLYTFNVDDDLNKGFNNKMNALGGTPLSTTYAEDSWNDFTWDLCETSGGCLQEIGPEVMHGQTRMMKFKGQEFDVIPGAEINFPGYSGLKWVSGVNFQNGTVFTDVFDVNKKYVLKQSEYSQKLAVVDASKCADPDNGVSYTSVNDAAFDDLKVLPDLGFDSEMANMPTWSDMPAVTDIATGCYVHDGTLFGVCED